MKDFIAASLIIVLILGGWVVFIHYAENQSNLLINQIRHEILPLAKDEDWASVQKKMETLNKDWHKFRKVTLYLLHTETINSIDYSIARSLKYTDAEDYSNTAGELNAAIEQLAFLTSNQKLTLQNIF